MVCIQYNSNGESVNIGHIEIFTRHMARARAFYENALGGELVSDQGQFVWLRLGSVEALLRPGNPPKPAASYAQSGTAIVLYTDALAAAVGQLEAHGVTLHPMDGEPGCFTFQDPDGNWFQLVNPGDHQG
jgi:catechol 2,3-dioxygenase-like lactoylglutathione lyase family enzyme